MSSPLPYIGGKSRMAKRIVELIPQHKQYVELFFGAGWVFFKKEQSKYEVINDLDNDLITFYRVLQNHLEEFIRQFKFALSSRQIFKDWKEQLETSGLTDIQRAARYYYIQRHAFSGKVKGRAFAASKMRYPKINLLRIEEDLSATHLRLSRVNIENLPYDKCIQLYDTPDTFFFIDPPYYKKPFYKHNFENKSDFEKLRDILDNLKGKFIMTHHDIPEIRDIFRSFIIKPIEIKYSANNMKGTQKNSTELLIMNY